MIARQGQARIRRFTSSHGFFCDISLHVDVHESRERRIECNPSMVPHCYHDAIAFGIDYALGNELGRGGWVARVDEFHYNVVDTTPETVALVTALALMHEAEQADKPFLDVERRVIVFPRERLGVPG